MTQLIHKRGDTFSYAWLMDNILPSGESQDFDATDWTGKCQIRRNGVLIDQIPFSWTTQIPAVFTTIKEDTKHWLPALHQIDVEFRTHAGQKISSPTIDVIVQEDITK